MPDYYFHVFCLYLKVGVGQMYKILYQGIGQLYHDINIVYDVEHFVTKYFYHGEENIFWKIFKTIDL